MSLPVLFVEELVPRHRLAVALHVARGGRVVYRKMQMSVAGRDWVRTSIAHGRLQPLVLDPPLVRSLDSSVAWALAAIERTWPVLSKKGSPRRMRALYQADETDLAYQKVLTEELSDLFYHVHLYDRASAALGPLRILPEDPRTPLTWAVWRRLARAAVPPPAGAWSFTLGAWGRAAVVSMRERARAAAVLAYTAALTLRRVRAPKAGSPETDRRVAIALVSPIREFANELRRFDFLVDDELLRRDETVFVPLYRLSDAQRTALRDRRVSWDDLREGPVGRPRVRTLLVALREFASSTTSPLWTVRAGGQLVRAYGRWSGFLQRHRPEAFVTYSDFGPGHVGRNILLHRAGARTLYYNDSANFALCAKGDPPLHPYFTHLLYTDMVVWDERMREYYQLHPQAISRWHVAGCLWSEDIRHIKSGKLALDARARLESLGWAKGAPLIAVFDSWYANDGPNTREDFVAFAEGILRLVEDLPGVFLVFKEKIPRHAFPPTFYEDARPIYEAYERISRHPRCRVLPHSASAAEVAAFADVVISFPFTSVSYETLCAGGRALYFDVAGKFRGTPYDKVPGLVAHDTQELVDRTRVLLYKTTPQDHEAWLRRHFVGHLAPHLEADAITRLRHVITEG